MSRRTLGLVHTFATAVVLAGSAMAQTTPPAHKQAKAAKACDAPAVDKAVLAIADSFFVRFLKGEYAEGLEGLSSVFAIGDSKRRYLADRMGELEKRLGRGGEVELLDCRRVRGTERVLTLYYATYHPLKPAFWELDFYRAPAIDKQPERWMLTSMKFETERVFDWLQRGGSCD